MSTTPQAFPPPNPQAPPGGAKPSPVGAAVAGAKPDMASLVPRAVAGIQAIKMLAGVLAQAKPEAAKKFNDGLATILQGVAMLKGGTAPGPTAPQGSVPPPPQMEAESPEQTPEAT